MKAKVGPFYSSRRSTSKLKNQRISIDGFKFASKLEAAVYQLLRLRVLKGEIEIVEHQSRVKLSEAHIIYVADFQCLNIQDHTPFFVEAKGFETSDWKIKKRLFGLGARVRLADKEIDREANLAVFIYRAEVYHLRSNVVIAECEGSANSQEVKYRERTVWRKKKLANGKDVSESVKEETPVFDLLNTLMKMSQKRALIGATIIATAASDYFTQDMEPDEVPAATQSKEAAAVAAVPSNVTELAPDQTNQVGQAPVCCGKEMMVSKYADRETGEYPYFCMKCRKKVPSGILAE